MIEPIEKTLNISAMYRYLFKPCDDSPKSLGWANREEQQYRFRKMCRVGMVYEDDCSILDVGCGFGDFIDYLGVVIGWGFQYKGIDVRKEAIEIAKTKHPAFDFDVSSVYDEKFKYRWVIANGIFSLDYPEWEIHTANTIDKMYELCNKGVAVNFIPTIPSALGGMLRRTSVDEVNTIVKDKYTEYTIQYSKDNNDITLYLYKGEEK